MLRDLLRSPSMMKDLVPFVIGLQSTENRTKMSWNVEDLFLWIAYEEKTLDLKWDIERRINKIIRLQDGSLQMEWCRVGKLLHL